MGVGATKLDSGGGSGSCWLENVDLEGGAAAARGPGRGRDRGTAIGEDDGGGRRAKDLA